MKNHFTFVFLFLLASICAMGQKVTLGGEFGWSSPQGSAFKSNGEALAKGGLNFDLDALYHPEKFDGKLGLGINLNSSILFGASTASGLDIGVYGLSLYGVKAHYKFFDSKVTPFASLSTGMSQFATPEITGSNGQVISKGVKNSSFGLRPEVGLHLGGFFLAVGYFTPMKYKVVGKNAGALQFSLGIRIKAL